MSQDNDDEGIRLRDKIAIAAMQALLTEHQNFKTFIEKDKDNYGDETKEEYFARIDKRVERLSIIAYRVADYMRKTRLRTFG